MENSNRNIQRSQSERAKSAQIRTDVDNVINSHANDCWNSWTNTNASLERRSNEIMDTKQKLQMHLHKIQREIFDVEKNIEMLRKAILDKSAPLKVAQTRLESRAHRQEVELCRDSAQQRCATKKFLLTTALNFLFTQKSGTCGVARLSMLVGRKRARSFFAGLILQGS